MYNFTLIVSIFIFAAYVLYHQPVVGDHIAWTAPANQAEFIRRQGKIYFNLGEEL